MFAGSRRNTRTLNIWPGYVDALSALLMVVIFVLLIFAFAHFLLSEILTGQESELSALHRQIAALAEQLGLEQEKSQQLNSQVTELTGLLSTLTDERDALNRQVVGLLDQQNVDQAQIRNQLLTLASLQEDIDALRKVREDLENRVGSLAATLEMNRHDAGRLWDRSRALAARLADEEERTLLAQTKLEVREIRIQALSAVVGRQSRALENQHELTADARAEIVLLNEQLSALRTQLGEIGRALAASEQAKQSQAAEIKDLGRRLNIALAREVNKLARYRSEFFGRLKEVLGDNPSIRVEGDRFMLQAELLFDSGSAQLGEQGRVHLAKLAATLKAIAEKIPEDIDWILRIDGHTDRVPISNERFASNWELSTARALSVVRYLARNGIPEQRMAGAGFSKFHPLDPADTPMAYRRNRRIEVKLTSR